MRPFFLSLLSMLPAKFNSAGLSAHRCNLFDPTIPTLPEFMWSFLHIYFKKLLARNVHHAYIDCLYYLAYLLWSSSYLPCTYMIYHSPKWWLCFLKKRSGDRVKSSNLSSMLHTVCRSQKFNTHPATQHEASTLLHLTKPPPGSSFLAATPGFGFPPCTPKTDQKLKVFCWSVCPTSMD